MNNIPDKLGENPIIQAMIELRYEPDTKTPQSALFGLLWQHFNTKGYDQYSDLPVSKMPEEMRLANPDLKYHALHEVCNDVFAIQIGPNSVSLINTAFKSNYPGGSNFMKEFLELQTWLIDNQVCKRIDRIGMRYINFFEQENLQDIANIDLKIGHLNTDTFNCSFLNKSNDRTNQVKVLNNTVIDINKSSRSGAVIDIDIWNNNPIQMSELRDHILVSHNSIREIFFDLVKQEKIQSMNPTYS